ncbi:putative disease resistance protein RGA3 [Oryza sativa Japonica Group]|uniref:Os09g0365000 protein n=4 Tax=Oryza TaxID=4527 RepID=C7J732_ORYSJ|nr:putative disease resistance protein RGA3 [Oryza sativa Japonica Group]BAH94531.1 Os09g0365000 [Oryza sativa Japonica Group]|eukprot:NP_001175803.1 Os09g0365000 [Oryza sativa Japonica Group]
MDSGNIGGSLQSSSGGDDEFDSRGGGGGVEGAGAAVAAAPATARRSRKRTRASWRTVTTDPSNFRAMVQEFTGIPSPPFVAGVGAPAASLRTRFDHLFPSPASALRSAAAGDPASSLPPYLLRPIAQKLPTASAQNSTMQQTRDPSALPHSSSFVTWTPDEFHSPGFNSSKQDERFVLENTLRGMYELIKLAECWVRKDYSIANLLQEAKDTVYCAEDLLDELNYYELQDGVGFSANRSSCPEFSDIKMTEIHGKLNSLKEQMGHLGLHDMQPQHFIFESVSQKYGNLMYDRTNFGYQEELQVLIDSFILDKNSLTSEQVSEVPSSGRAGQKNLSVLTIVGDGGIGKTALAHCSFNDQKVQDHFDLLVWICVSDGFDDKKLIKRLAWAIAESEMKSDDLICLQRVLTNGMIHHSRRLLLVLDDLQEDVCQEYYLGWERFLAPLKCASPGSMVLVTTRSMKVAEHISSVCLQLEGLPNEINWHLFSMHAFDLPISDSDQEVECIGRKIAARLNGSPLGAKIVGCLLNLKLDAVYWKSILESELWELGHHKETRIWPALHLSYQYLPFHLKRCFSFCSMYPKSHEFDAETLVDSWVAVGLVVSNGSVPAVDIGHEYFDQLVRRSFFQISPTSSSSRHAYVMQGLLYETAQKISTNECFVIKDSSDLLRIPPKVRHVSILHFSGLSSSDLESLHKYKTLRSVVCISIDSDVITTSVLETWFCHLTNIRMLRFISCRLKELLGNVGNLILLRYLDISSCDFEALPDSFWRLRNLEILDAQNCRFDSVPKDIVKLVKLRKARLRSDLNNQLGHVPGVGNLIYLQDMPYYAVDDTPGRGIQELKNLNNLRGALEISGLHNVTSKEQAVEADLDKKTHLNTLTLSWHDSIRPDKHNGEQEMEVLESLRPSPSIKNLEVRFYMGSGFHPSWLLDDEPISSRLESLSISSCPNIASLFITVTGSSSRGSSPVVFRSLTKLSVTWCRKLMSLDNLLQPELLPEIKVIRISNCEELASLPTNQLIKFTHLEDLEVSHCWSLSWEQGLTLPRSLKSLKLEACGELTDSVLRCGLRELPVLVSLELQFCSGVECIGGEIWSEMPSLQRLKIFCCQELSSIGGEESIARVESVDIRHCPKLRELEQPFQRG